MVAVSFKRELITTQSTVNVDIIPGYLNETSDAMYLPLLVDDFTAPDLSITGCTLTSAATKIVGTAGKFDDVRIGDIVSAASTGTLTAKATVERACGTFTGLKFVVYPSTNNSTNLGVKVGDAVTGTGIPANTVVDKIDHSTRRIFLDKNVTANGSEVTLTFAPPVRVTAVRPSTASSNANEIDIDSTVATNGANSTITIKTGGREAAVAILKITPVGSTSNGRVNVNVGFSSIAGAELVGTADGQPANMNTRGYSSLGSLVIDADAYFLAARVPRPTN